MMIWNKMCKRGSFITNLVSNHYLIKGWFIVDWTFQNKFHSYVICIISAICYVSWYQLIEAKWGIYSSVQHTNIGSDNGLSPTRRQAIIWTSAAMLSIRPHEPMSVKFFLNLFIQGNALENVNWKMAVILPRPQCAEGLHATFRIV